jgi:hypothetical protein
MLPRFPYAGAVDADGHVLEPPDLWDRYLEARFRDRPMGIRRDAEGLEYLEIAGRPSKMVRRNLPQGLGAMDLVGGIPAPAGRVRTGLGYLDNAGLGAWDARERLERLDQKNLDLAILYPTLGVLWEAEVRGPGARAGVRAGLQPLDRRVLRGGRRAARADRAPLPRAPRGGRAGAGTGCP